MHLVLGKEALRLERGGHCVFRGEEWTNHPHRHPDYQEICWVTAGIGEFYHGTERYALHVGSCFISEPNIVHEIASPDQGHLELFFMTFQMASAAGFVDAAIKKIWQRFQQGHRIHAEMSQVPLYIQLLQSASSERQDLLMRALFVESLTALSDAVAEDVFASEQLRQQNQQNQLQQVHAERAMAYIREHCCTGLTVAEIAAAVDLSERQLRRCVKAQFNCGLVDAINAARLDQAKRLLLMQRSIAAVAQAVGIASPAMFSRLFKQAFGCTPSQWRQQQVPSGILPRTVFGRS